MKKRIKLYYNIGTFEDGVNFIQIDDDVEFVLNYEKPQGSKMYYIINNGEIVKKGLVENNKFTLESSYIKLGKIEMKLEVEMLGKIIKTFVIEPLIIQKLDERLEAIPQIVEMENKIKDLTEQVEVLNNRLDFFVKLWKEGV